MRHFSRLVLAAAGLLAFGTYAEARPPNPEGMGSKVVALGDVDGDGRIDFAAGAYGMNLKKQKGLYGGVLAFSGKTGKVLWKTLGADGLSLMGKAMAAIGDVDGDGITDLAVGAPSISSKAGRVEVLSGKTGRRLARTGQ